MLVGSLHFCVRFLSLPLVFLLFSCLLQWIVHWGCHLVPCFCFFVVFWWYGSLPWYLLCPLHCGLCFQLFEDFWTCAVSFPSILYILTCLLWLGTGFRSSLLYVPLSWRGLYLFCFLCVCCVVQAIWSFSSFLLAFLIMSGFIFAFRWVSSNLFSIFLASASSILVCNLFWLSKYFFLSRYVFLFCAYSTCFLECFPDFFPDFTCFSNFFVVDFILCYPFLLFSFLLCFFFRIFVIFFSASLYVPVVIVFLLCFPV